MPVCEVRGIAQVCVNLCPQSVNGSPGESDSECVLPQLPLPCLNSAQTRVFFGHERRLAEGENTHTHTDLKAVHDTHKCM